MAQHVGPIGANGVVTRAAIDDVSLPVPRVESVDARPTVETVPAGAAGEKVIADAPEEGVVACAAIEPIVAQTAVDRVLAGTGEHKIVAPARPDRFGASRPYDSVGVGPSVALLAAG